MGGFEVGDTLRSAFGLADVFVGEGDRDGDGGLAGAGVLPFDLEDERDAGGLFGEEAGNLDGIEAEVEGVSGGAARARGDPREVGGDGGAGESRGPLEENAACGPCGKGDEACAFDEADFDGEDVAASEVEGGHRLVGPCDDLPRAGVNSDPHTHPAREASTLPWARVFLRLLDDLGRLLAILESHIVVLDGEGDGAGGAAGAAVFPLDLHGEGDAGHFALEGEKLVHDLAGVEVELEDIVGPGAIAELAPAGRPGDRRAAEIGGLFEDDAARSPVGKLLDDAIGLEADMDGESVAAPGKEGGDRGVAVIADGKGVEIDKETHTFGREASTLT